MSNQKPLSAHDLRRLRENDMLMHDEVAVIVGDMVIAENVITKNRRVLNTGNILLESKRRILRD